MKLMPYGLGAALCALLVLPVAAPASASASADPGPAAAAGHSPTAIGAFLIDFYGEHGPSERDRELRVSQHLKDRQAHSADLDVLLCARSAPRDIGIGPATVAPGAGIGWATVTTYWAGGGTDTFTAYVRLDSWPIRLDDVVCAG
ncbi:hypothetical protein ACIQV2_13610 [Streptomyces globosus]|uniref:hypothetical protein n=1 Tax=Streptomyces globosus TaxID=68209 RepID=UPI0038309669